MCLKVIPGPFKPKCKIQVQITSYNDSPAPNFMFFISNRPLTWVKCPKFKGYFKIVYGSAPLKFHRKNAVATPALTQLISVARRTIPGIHCFVMFLIVDFIQLPSDHMLY